MLKKCNVPHPDVPMAAFDRIFVEVNWTADPSPDSSDKSMDLGEFMEALIRVAETRYAVEDLSADEFDCDMIMSDVTGVECVPPTDGVDFDRKCLCDGFAFVW